MLKLVGNISIQTFFITGLLQAKPLFDSLIPITQVEEVQKIVAQREQTDILLAQELSRAYTNNEEIQGIFYDLAKTSASHLNDLIAKENISNRELEKFIKAELQGLSLWDPTHGPTVNQLFNLADQPVIWWDLSKYAALYRLYAAFFEYFSGLKDEAQKIKSEFSLDEPMPVQKLYQLVNFGFSSRYDLITSGESARKLWREKTLRIGNLYTGDPFTKYKKRAKAKKTLPNHLIDYLNLRTPITGIMMAELKDDSTVKKIDTIYCLPQGADISGTTADTLFGIFQAISLLEVKVKLATEPAKSLIADRVQRIYSNLDALILLPVIVLTQEYHHSLLESAMVLSLNSLISYHIGWYSTLLDKRGISTDFERTIEKILSDFDEQVPRGIGFSSKSGVVGYRIPQGVELRHSVLYKQSLLTAETYIKYANLKPGLTEEQVRKLFDEPKE